MFDEGDYNSTHPFIFVACVAVLFTSLNLTIQRLRLGYSLAVVDYKQQKLWWWRDFITAFVYTSTVSTLAVLSFILHPDYLNDVINTTHPIGSYMLAVTLGRFVFHTVFVIRQHGFKYRLQLLHHAIGLVGLSMVLATGKYHAIMMSFHFSEIPLAVFCVRGLLIIAGHGQRWTFHVTKWIFMILYIPFRFVALGISFTYFLMNIHRISPLWHLLICSSWFAFLIPYNMTVFVRLLKRDFLDPPKKAK